MWGTFVVFPEKALQMRRKLLLYKYMFPLWRALCCIGSNASAAHDGRKVEDMSEKKLAASAAAQTPEAPGEIGRASCRERVELAGVGGWL